MDLGPAIFASGWASGVNAYLCVVVLGMLGRFGGFEAVPVGLTRTDVLIVAAVLYAFEFVADKIPYIDSIWDTVSTAIRPTAGAVIGLLIAHDAPTLQQAVYAVTGGTAALASHAVKTLLRLIVNTSPEPVTNIGVSVSEDVAVAGVTSLAVISPTTAMVIAGILLVLGIVLVWLLWSRVRRGVLRFRAWRERRSAAAAG